MELTDVQFCYAAALIEGLELINDKARDLGIKHPERHPFEADALMVFVRDKGDQYYTRWYIETGGKIGTNGHRCGCGRGARHRGWCEVRRRALMDAGYNITFLRNGSNGVNGQHESRMDAA